MNATPRPGSGQAWQLGNWLAVGIARLMQRRYGALEAWPMLRVIWLSGALDGREFWRSSLARRCAAARVDALASGHCFIDPRSPEAMEGMLRSWPDLVEAFRARGVE